MADVSDADLRHYEEALSQSKVLLDELKSEQTLPQTGATIQKLEGCYELMDSILRANDLANLIPNSRLP